MAERNIIMSDIYSPIQYLKGVGEQRAKLYKKLGVDTIYSLLSLFPRVYKDFSQYIPINKCKLNENVCIKAKIFKKQGETRIRKGLSIFKVFATDGEADVTITIFNSKYIFESLLIGKEYIFIGKLTGNLLKKEMTSPEFISADNAELIKSVYPLTSGLSSSMISKTVQQAFNVYGDNMHETLPSSIKKEFSLCHKRFAYEKIHFPDSMETMEIARKRLIFEELLVLQLGLLMLKSKNNSQTAVKINDYDITGFLNSLKFTLTGAQLKAINDGLSDYKKDTPMSRLVQGDVGSGKTMVACALAYIMAKNLYQSAIMAPTEILAIQHYNTFKNTFESMGIKVALLTGSTKAKEKREIKQAIENGEIHIVVGTHALIQDSVIFKNLGLVITDEQHRFGVEQRSKLTQKGNNPHTLVMSATPIPRTLALIIYGDLDISVIDEMPKGRLLIKTYLIDSKKRARAQNFIKQHIDEGKQAYVVCPLIEEGEDDKLSVNEYAQSLAKSPLKNVRIGILHGKMKAKEKEDIMNAFKLGEIDLLVSTTVVEVGVDVPNACIMMIENAENFGLSQLHQLRGRVGRGSDQAYCILVSDSDSDTTLKRLKIMEKSSDGFYISEQDLKQRGPGDFFGNKQHGLPKLKIADMIEDIAVLKQTSVTANKILAEDSNLSKPENLPLKETVETLFDNIGL